MGGFQSRPTPVEVYGVPLQDLSRRVTKQGGPETAGGHADVYRGIWRKDRLGEKEAVAIKTLRMSHIHEEKKKKIMKRLFRELGIWGRCHHPNILPLYGVMSDSGPVYSMVCPWMEQGNINNYLQYHPALPLDQRLAILCDVAAGLKYLHSCSIVHGDLTGPNVLIDSDGRARLTDFGLAQAMAAVQGSEFYTSTISQAFRWTAPELYSVDDNAIKIDAPCDIYSIGSIMLQVLSGKVPYHYFMKEATILLRLKDGEKPRRPNEIALNDSHWDLIQRCWADHPAERPIIDSVLDHVRLFYFMETDREYGPTEGQAYTGEGRDLRGDEDRTTSNVAFYTRFRSSEDTLVF